MKTFDAASIYSRMLSIISQDPDWKAVVNDSVVASILKANAESNSEVARYVEYLFKESKWDSAQNVSSIAAAAGALGYKPARKQSAFGKIYVSADPKIHQVGRRFYKDDFLNGHIPWGVLKEDVNINTSITITDSRGVSYICTTSAPLEANRAYTENVIMQGIVKEMVMPISVARIVATRSKLDPYVFIPMLIPDCENAATAITQPFFRVFIAKAGGALEEYRVVDTLHLTGSGDRDVEVYPDLYNPELIYLKFNASPARGKMLNLTEGAGIESIVVRYVETKGSEGNLKNIFEPFTLSNIPGKPGLNLYGINFEALLGGSNAEQAYDIKKNAPLYYMSSYTASTQEAYENLIKKIDFGNGQRASKVRVFPGFYEDPATGVVRNVTHVTLLLPSLEDLSGSETTGENNPYSQIENIINFYLARLKAPTDILKFSPPTYGGIGIGVRCSALRRDIENIVDLKESIRTTLDEKYGSNSIELDFGRSIYEADIVTAIKNLNPAILSVDIELEAVQKLSWARARSLTPNPNSILSTIRVPFDFNPVFRGKSFIKGFRDYKTGAAYVLRFDIFYKQNPLSTLPAYHTSIFIEENLGRSQPGFYHVNDPTGIIWDPATIVAAEYPFSAAGPDKGFEELPSSYQFYYKREIFDDDNFSKLISSDSLSAEGTLVDYTLTPGSVDNYLIQFSGDYADDDGKIGEGYFEFEVTSMYGVLQRYAEQDAQLRNLLQQYPLSIIKCNTAGPAFDGFVRDVLMNYVEIQVSARPVDKNLTPSLSTDSIQKAIVLYADTSDEESTNVSTTNLSAIKRERILSVDCELV